MDNINQVVSYNLQSLVNDVQKIQLPSPSWGVHINDDFISILLVVMCNQSIRVKKSILITENENKCFCVQIFFNGVLVDIPYVKYSISDIYQLNLLIKEIDKVQFCRNHLIKGNCKLFGTNYTDICENCNLNLHNLSRDNGICGNMQYTSIKHPEENFSDKENSYICTKCFEMCPTIEAMKCHAYVFHNDSLHYVSDTTSTMNDDKSTLPIKSENSRHENFSCILCQNTFKEQIDLRTHEMQHIDGTQEHFQCTICKENFGMLDSVVKHYKKHHPAAAYIKCLFCSKCFASGQQLRVHSRKHHSTKLLTCPNCDKTFHKQILLKEHLYTHTPKAPYACKLCKEQFTRRTPFRLHLVSHTSHSSLLCNICGKIFENAPALNEHRSCHFRGRHGKNNCQICHKSFNKNIHLISHLRTHTGNTSFSCDKCSVDCSSYNSLLNHQMVHRNEHQSAQKDAGSTDFKCKICEKTFEKAFRLKIHERLHEKKSFICEICGKGFSTEGNLNIHQKLHSN